jgi:diaminohydroxyphosphoribosylaminopyrimidine deaminase/5-amino-6-(5-phosphoribosylamino)uracil reductase
VNFGAFDHDCMALALGLARRGLTTTHPNPRVGCVIARDEHVIGRGWHRHAGGRHAEIHALADAGGDVAGATAYITLEPCSFAGRTPPCTDALIEAGIGRVVCAMEDPNPRVSGAGIARLREAGIEAQCGLMADAAVELNPGFIMRMRHGRPHVRVKLAQSTDGHIALANGSSQWISSEAARADVQRWRARSDAILTGIGTVLADDPQLSVRLEGHERQPLKVVVDSHWRTPADARIFTSGGNVFVAGRECNASRDALSAAGAQTEALPGDGGRVDVRALMQELAEREINEVQVEAGAKLCGELLRLHLVDEVLIYQAPVLLGGGAVSPFAFPRLENMNDRVQLQWIESRRVGNDLRLRMKPAPPN